MFRFLAEVNENLLWRKIKSYRASNYFYTLENNTQCLAYEETRHHRKKTIEKIDNRDLFTATLTLDRKSVV